MITRIKSDKIIVGDEILSGYVYFEDGIILGVSREERHFDLEYDLTGLYVSPGFIDIHTHGGNGYDFISSERDVVEGANFHLLHGTTSICPTISAAPFEKMKRAVGYVKSAMNDPALRANVIGAHLEGPYLSAAQCGAQSTSFITAPDEDEYRELVISQGDAIARWTYAPENDNGGEFCRFITERGIVASAGHTNAEYSDMLIAEESGCGLITHLYSCTSTITRKQGFRHLGVIESAYLSDGLFVEIIADGKHLPPELISLIVKIKGSDRVALVSDSLSIAGTDVKHGFMVDTEYIIEDGVCKLMDRSAFAGSIATADLLVRTVTAEAGIPLTEAVKMMTKVPAKIMHLNKGELSEGMDADIIAFDENINVKKAFVCGREVF